MPARARPLARPCPQLLLAPAINHANLVQTFTSRCARLTHEFFDLLEGVGVGVQGGGSSR